MEVIEQIREAILHCPTPEDMAKDVGIPPRSERIYRRETD